MILIVVLFVLALLVGSALVWGTDSRDGHDWTSGRGGASDPYPAGAGAGAGTARAGRYRAASALWAHHEG